MRRLIVSISSMITLMTAASPSAAPAEPAASQPLGHPHPGLRVALAQLPIEDGNLEQNMRLAEEAARQAAEQKADLLNLPEAADWGWLYQQARRDALPIPGKYTDFLAALARRHKMWVSAGCLEKDGDKVYNSAVIIDRTGRIVLKHRKIDTLPELTKHLYDRGNPEDIKTVDTEFGRIGLTICADNFNLKNPQRVADQGAWLLIAPHGFAAEESKLEQNSREYQNHIRKVAGATRLWVVATDAVLGTIQGGAWKGQLHSGCSLVARPDGTAAIVAKFKQPDLIVLDIPAGQVSKPAFGKGRVKIGGVQTAGLRGDKTNNIAKAERMIRAAAAQGAQVIMTPEVALTGFVGGEQERAMAEPIPGPTSEHFGQLAKELAWATSMRLTSIARRVFMLSTTAGPSCMESCLTRKARSIPPWRTSRPLNSRHHSSAQSRSPTTLLPTCLRHLNGLILSHLQSVG